LFVNEKAAHARARLAARYTRMRRHARQATHRFSRCCCIVFSLVAAAASAHGGGNSHGTSAISCDITTTPIRTPLCRAATTTITTRRDGN
jgi:hypothetical protein